MTRPRDTGEAPPTGARAAAAALLWDIDGTLIDTTTLIVEALDHIYHTHIGRTLPRDDLRALIGTPLVRQIRVFGEPETFGADPGAMERDFVLYYEARRELECIIEPAVEALIAGSRAGRPTALVTSKNDVEIANTLPRLGIAPFVDVVVSADDVSRPKPQPDAVLLALERLGVRASEALYIGDTVHDMRAARGAGVPACAVTWGAAPEALLRAERPQLLCREPRELARLIGLSD